MAFVFDKNFNPGTKDLGEPGADAPLVVADPFSLDSLIAWLEKQEGETRYDYTKVDRCLIGQYVTAMGGEFSGTAYRIGNATLSATTGGDNTLHKVAYLHQGEDTFSAALARARLLSSSDARSGTP